MDLIHIKKEIDAGNSGTLARLILGLLVNSTGKIKIIGDDSLSRRDFSRVTEPLKKFKLTSRKQIACRNNWLGDVLFYT